MTKLNMESKKVRKKKAIKELKIMAFALWLVSFFMFRYWLFPFFVGFMMGGLLILALLGIEKLRRGL